MRYISSIFNSSLGNILEWYDFGLFTIFSPLLSKLFFPSYNPHAAMIATFSIFAIGFICRPIGALIFGYLGDRKGRAQTLRLSILMISLPTILIGFLPTYQQIGLIAPLLLAFMRMWQGVSLGGEYSGNLIYLAEIAPKKHRALLTSFAPMGANIGILLAALIGIITTELISYDQLYLWGWRLPYLISGLFCLFIYKFRSQIRETFVFDYLKKKIKLPKNPISLVLQKNKKEILRTIGLTCMGSSFYYFIFAYLPIYLNQNFQISIHNTSMMISSLVGMMLILIPLGAIICDRVGRRKMLLFNSTFIGIIIIPGFYCLHLNYAYLLIVFILFTVASSLEQATTSIAVIENFPPPARYTGVSLGYNITNGFIGGTVPFIGEWLHVNYHFTILPAIYIFLYALVTGIVILFFVPDTENRSLVSFDAIYEV